MEALEARRRGGAALDPQQAAKLAQRPAAQAALDALSGGATVASLQVSAACQPRVHLSRQTVIPSRVLLVPNGGNSVRQTPRLDVCERPAAHPVRCPASELHGK